MPIYEFKCNTCGTHFDRLQKLSDPEPEACPECGKPTVQRVVTAPSFRLAGAGWYETDFKKDGDKKRNLAGKDEGASSAGEAKSAETKTGEPSKPSANDGGKSAATPAAESKPAKSGTPEAAKPAPAKATPSSDA